MEITKEMLEHQTLRKVQITIQGIRRETSRIKREVECSSPSSPRFELYINSLEGYVSSLKKQVLSR